MLTEKEREKLIDRILTGVSLKVENGGFQPISLVDLNNATSEVLYLHPTRTSLATTQLSEQHNLPADKT